MRRRQDTNVPEREPAVPPAPGTTHLSVGLPPLLFWALHLQTWKRSTRGTHTFPYGRARRSPSNLDTRLLIYLTSTNKGSLQPHRTTARRPPLPTPPLPQGLLQSECLPDPGSSIGDTRPLLLQPQRPFEPLPPIPPAHPRPLASPAGPGPRRSHRPCPASSRCRAAQGAVRGRHLPPACPVGAAPRRPWGGGTGVSGGGGRTRPRAAPWREGESGRPRGAARPGGEARDQRSVSRPPAAAAATAAAAAAAPATAAPAAAGTGSRRRRYHRGQGGGAWAGPPGRAGTRPGGKGPPHQLPGGQQQGHEAAGTRNRDFNEENFPLV